MFTNRVTAVTDTLLRQTGLTAENYLRHALEAVDQQLGEGQARKNPEVVAAFMRCCAEDFRTTLMVQTLQEGFEAIAQALGDRRA